MTIWPIVLEPAKSPRTIPPGLPVFKCGMALRDLKIVWRMMISVTNRSGVGGHVKCRDKI